MMGMKSKVRDCIRRFHSGGVESAVMLVERKRLGLWRKVSGSQLDNPVVWLQVTNRVHGTLVRRLKFL